jgi:hypothetical protein
MKNFTVYCCATKILSPPPLGATALREPWPPVLFASTGPYPELFFSIVQQKYTDKNSKNL